MFKSILAALAVVFLSITTNAAVIGGPEVGWTIDTASISAEQKKSFGWYDHKLKTSGFREFSDTLSVPGMEPWKLSGKLVAHQEGGGPAFFTITELHSSSLEDLKKAHYRGMSAWRGFTEAGCIATEFGAQSCEVLLHNWSPPKGFHAVFYQWKVADRVFALTVRNAQSTPDRETTEAAARALISLIQQQKSE